VAQFLKISRHVAKPKLHSLLTSDIDGISGQLHDQAVLTSEKKVSVFI
jgi:hypothetical protein